MFKVPSSISGGRLNCKDEMLHETLWNINEAVCRETLVNPSRSFLMLADASVNG